MLMDVYIPCIVICSYTLLFSIIFCIVFNIYEKFI